MPKHEAGHSRTEQNNNVRKNFRFSVIPRGVYSPEELARARRVDGVVAAHYADFGHSTTALKASKDNFYYVSYRKADRVFWTTYKVKVAKGELLLTDGRNLARARCGNRISPVPQKPTALRQPTGRKDIQPPEQELAELELPDIAILPSPAPPLFYPEYAFATPPLDLPPGTSGGATSPATPSGATGTEVANSGWLGLPANSVGSPPLTSGSWPLPPPHASGPQSDSSSAPVTGPTGSGVAGAVTAEPVSVGLLAFAGATFLVGILGRGTKGRVPRA